MSFSKKEAIKEGIESSKLLPTDQVNEHWNAKKMMSEEMKYQDSRLWVARPRRSSNNTRNKNYATTESYLQGKPLRKLLTL